MVLQRKTVRRPEKMGGDMSYFELLSEVPLKENLSRQEEKELESLQSIVNQKGNHADRIEAIEKIFDGIKSRMKKVDYLKDDFDFEEGRIVEIKRDARSISSGFQGDISERTATSRSLDQRIRNLCQILAQTCVGQNLNAEMLD